MCLSVCMSEEEGYSGEFILSVKFCFMVVFNKLRPQEHTQACILNQYIPHSNTEIYFNFQDAMNDHRHREPP